MDKLIEKAKASKWWKWAFAALIFLGILFLLWMIRRKNNELQRFKAEKLVAEETAKDAAAKAEVEKNAEAAKALREEAARFVEKADALGVKITAIESDIQAAKKKVEDAKNWKELAE